jgi:stage V sporulation protein G
MNITQVHVVPKEDERVKGYASIVLEECFLVNDIKIISGTHGCFISMPSRKRKNGKFRDIAHPITKEMREKIESSIFDAYEKTTGQKIPVRAMAPPGEPGPADPSE